MRRKLFSVSVCIVAFTIILSGCADRQNNNDLQSSEPQNSEIVTSTQSSFLTESDTGAEHSTPSTDNEQSNVTDGSSSNDNSTTEKSTVEKMNLQIGNSSFTATLESNAAVDALVDMMREAPVVIQMSDYSGFEKVGSLGTSLPTSNKQTTTQSGDIVLYNGNQIVIFYGSNSWSYTRLGRIDDLSGWKDALGSGGVIVTFSID